MKKLFVRYANLLIPGLENWPSYSNAETERFWKDWKSASPLSTQIGLLSCLIIIDVYCKLNAIKGIGAMDSLAKMESSPVYLLRQSHLMLKTIACMAYFSDPAVYATAIAGKNQQS